MERGAVVAMMECGSSEILAAHMPAMTRDSIPMRDRRFPWRQAPSIPLPAARSDEDVVGFGVVDEKGSERDALGKLRS